MSNNIDLYLRQIESAKSDMKSALIEKGSEPVGGLNTYAEAVRNIPSIPQIQLIPFQTTIKENGNYTFTADEGFGYSTIDISVDVPEIQLIPFQTTIKENGNYTFTADEGFGYSTIDISVDVPEIQLIPFQTTIKENGNYTFTADEGFGYSTIDISVDVPNSGGGGDGKPKIINGFRFTGGDISKVDFSQYDWSNVYDTSLFFSGCTHSTGDWSNFEQNFNGKIMSVEEMFYNCSKLTSVPDINSKLDGCVCTRAMFGNCSNLTSIPDIPNLSPMDADSMFTNCSNLTSVPRFDTSRIFKADNIFNGCSKLTSIPDWFDTSSMYSIIEMFGNCSKLTSIPDLDLSNVANFGGSVYNSWVAHTSSLTSIGEIKCDGVRDVSYALSSDNSNLTHLGGFKNLGKVYELTGSDGTNFLNNVPNLTYESIINVLNGLYDRASNRLPIITLKLHANHLSQLTEDDIAIATNKGWNLI